MKADFPQSSVLRSHSHNAQPVWWLASLQGTADVNALCRAAGFHPPIRNFNILDFQSAFKFNLLG